MEELKIEERNILAYESPKKLLKMFALLQQEY